jgi:hypothetical protein
MGTNCAPLLADFFLYSYKADFIQGLLKKNEKKLARSFNFTFRYIDDVLDDISFRELFGRIRVFVVQNNICPFLAQGICIYVGHSFH